MLVSLIAAARAASAAGLGRMQRLVARSRSRHAHGVQHDAVLRVHAVLGLVKNDGVGCAEGRGERGGQGRDGGRSGRSVRGQQL